MLLSTLSPASADPFADRSGIVTGALDARFDYDSPYSDPALYIHPLTNYEHHPSWQLDWESNLLAVNGFRLTAGSVSTTDLLVNGQLSLNHALSGGWRFRSQGWWRSTRHENASDLGIYVGLERRIAGGLAGFGMIQPDFDKEFVDAQLGLSLLGRSREKYLSVALVLGDVVYDKKNDRNGRSVEEPRGVQWFLRWGKGSWWIYSEGSLSSGFERVYPGAEGTTDETAHSQRINRGTVRLYRRFAGDGLLQLGANLYGFAEGKTFADDRLGYDYRNDVLDVSAQAVIPLRGRHRLRLLTHGVNQEADATGTPEHRFERRDVIPAAFLETAWGGHGVDVGYMFAVQNWRYEAAEGGESYEMEGGYFDKLALGYTYDFGGSATLRASVSHEARAAGFGGGNVQYMMFF